MRTATDLLLLLVLSIDPSACLVAPAPPNRLARRRSSSAIASSSSSSTTTSASSCVENVGVGHPALLDAISAFSPEDSPDARRIFHGRGGLHEGADHLTLDYYPPVFLLTSFRELEEAELDAYGDALGELWEGQVQNGGGAKEDAPMPSSELAWVYQCRAQKGNSTTRLMSGSIPQPHIVTESNGRDKYLVNLLRHQNHGLFLDMSSGRSWLRKKCASGDVSSVLNLFSYTCAFSIAALNGGADSVVNVDMSKGALKQGQRNHEINGLKGKGARFLAHDLFKSWGKLKRLGPYDCVVVDPPSYQKGSFVAVKDYIKVIRRLPSLLTLDGWALLCLNAPELDTDWLLGQVEESGAKEEGLCFVERLENPQSFASKYPERALKVLAFRFRPDK